ncbi:uncharacterized protein LOC118364836 isoform X5 [Oncorhynchus keta]|uniref:uncharacterized protein LOC118364836 isoform X5 n=1 Tax=Oncorhynchus keta TaxID=8018 RepID=UPI0015FC5E73|nr:uncharacterized protein LOC118364836 isoform X5 [Oncorhynchus keta]
MLSVQWDDSLMITNKPLKKTTNDTNGAPEWRSGLSKALHLSGRGVTTDSMVPLQAVSQSALIGSLIRQSTIDSASPGFGFGRGGHHLFCEMEFLERTQGDSIEFYCISEFSASKPIGFYLKRKWLQPNREVLFIYTEQNPVFHPDVKERIHVMGDPSTHRVNVTLSQLKGTDTDLYYCEFVFPDSSSLDQKIPSKMEFFLYVVDAEDAPDSKMDVGLIETCAGGSAVLPCLAPYGSPSAMEGVCLKRRWGRAPVEVLFHSKRPFSSASFPPEERLHLGTGLGGLAYNLTLLKMQPEESAFYSCELLLPGRPDNSARLGRHVYFVSVQG